MAPKNLCNLFSSLNVHTMQFVVKKTHFGMVKHTWVISWCLNNFFMKNVER